MKIVIIEDELLVAEDLASNLKQIKPDIEIVSILSSVKEAIDYFSKNSQPDLIFSDIQLGDGLSFDIAKVISIEVPVIFCTAFDEYALEAFRINGIEYILKPFSAESLEKALLKFQNMQKVMAGSIALKYEATIATLEAKNKNSSGTIMVKYRDRLLPFTLDKIALFFLENEITYLHTNSGSSFAMTESLEELEHKAGLDFFRMNRQFLVNRNVITEATDYFPRKLKINLSFPFKKDIIVSREKRGKLLIWLTEN
ncbi:LytR/AlgR family response regulator transcription factor [Flavobacterium daemonense]|uniref:LytR/AlgR family response regulator transcription factor n=1 Tax=Flavobacterium daemonense TaxID=1393049 RepID=UPI0013A63A7B|nr:LytTR family DNA-binding domain-containing protein [Flavobacterium daemonense]KAF2336842.1 response regulator transcription factor [Flavobacterium daemonense]